MATKSASKKTLYHSELVNMGSVMVKITSDVLESKYKKGSYYVGLEVDGEERTYNIENDACGEALDGRKGQTVLLTATGSRDDAEITLGAAPGGTAPAKKFGAAKAAPEPADNDQVPGAEAPAATPPPRNTSAAALATSDPIIDARLYLTRHANAIGLAADAALYAITEFAQRHEVPVDKATIAAQMCEEMTKTMHTTLYIALKDSWRDDNSIAHRQPVGSLNAALEKRKAVR